MRYVIVSFIMTLFPSCFNEDTNSNDVHVENTYCSMTTTEDMYCITLHDR